MRNRSEQTICAVSTPQGHGGIAVIRVSGPSAVRVAKKISPALSKKAFNSHHAYFAKIRDAKNDVVDEAVVTFFAEGKSFTGEDTVEISCHGSEVVVGKVLELLVDSGCVLAEKGEFTYRAFMNNRIDLVQAESVLSLIESQNEAAARVAVRQLQGQMSKRFLQFESDLTWCLAHIEASIDFSSEGIEVVDPKVLMARLQGLQITLEELVGSYRSGRLLKDGIKVVLLGEPNVGKSSLLNLLSQDDKAIVTEIAGTTRDVINASTLFDGLRFTVSDTAGLRESTDLVEKMGIERSHREATSADLVLYVINAAEPNWDTAKLQIQAIRSPVIVVLNKADLVASADREIIGKNLQSFLSETAANDMIFTSNLDPKCRDSVLNAVRAKLGTLNTLDEAILTSARQYEMASYALEMVKTSVIELEKNLGSEFVAMYLKESLLSVQRILGHVYDDQILDRVFKEFCLGK